MPDKAAVGWEVGRRNWWCCGLKVSGHSVLGPVLRVRFQWLIGIHACFFENSRCEGCEIFHVEPKELKLHWDRM